MTLLCAILRNFDKHYVFQVKLVRCIVQNIVVDISFNQSGGLSTLCFLEHVDRQIGKNHLLKRSILLIKCWCYYESRILGSHHGLISTYALETLVLYIFHMFHSSLNGPLAVLYKFLDYYGKFDWDKYCVSLYGPVLLSSLPELVGDDSENSGGDKLFTEGFLKNCVEKFSVTPVVSDIPTRSFVRKHLNIVDPLKDNNNLGRSVGKGNFYRIRSAFAYGARKLARLLHLPTEQIEAEVHAYFKSTLERHGSGERPDTRDMTKVAGKNSQITTPSEELCADFTSITVSNRAKESGWLKKKTESSSSSDAASSRLADLSGEFDLHMNNLMRVQYNQDYAMSSFYPLSPQARAYQYQNSNGWDRGWHGVYPHMSSNGMAPPFPPSGGYPVSPTPFIHSAYGREDYLKSRGTGTYFPVTNYDAYRERNQHRKGKNISNFNSSPRTRNNYQLVSVARREEKRVEEPTTPPPQLQLPVIAKSVQQTATSSPPPLIKEQQPICNANVTQGVEGELKFGTLSPVPVVAPPTIQRGRSFDSVNPRNNGNARVPAPAAPAPRKLLKSNSNLERSTQIFRLKDEGDFPPLSG